MNSDSTKTIIITMDEDEAHDIIHAISHIKNDTVDALVELLHKEMERS